MTPTPWVSLVALSGWLVLAVAAYRARNVRRRQTIAMALGWAAIFLVATAIFSTIRR